MFVGVLYSNATYLEVLDEIFLFWLPVLSELEGSQRTAVVPDTEHRHFVGISPELAE